MSQEVDGFHDPLSSSDDDDDPGSDDDDDDGVNSKESFELTPDNVQDDLLTAARNGCSDRVEFILGHCKANSIQCDINYKGTNKANLGWTALHLAAYFGHDQVVAVLIKHGADINVQNDTGDTPLHKAAYTGREEVVTLLLNKGADVLVKNAEGLLAKNLARTEAIQKLIEAAENYDTKRTEAEFLRAARDGDMNKLTNMLHQQKPANINCTDDYGNSALHNATYRGHREVVVLLVQNGIDTTLKNVRGQIAEDMAHDVQMKRLVSLEPVKSQNKQAQRMEGPLLKKTRMLGWRPVWVVLEKGVVSLFRNRADASTGAKRKSFRYLNEAHVKIPTDQDHILQVVFPDRSTWYLSVQLDTSVQINRQRWISAIKDHISYSKQWALEGATVSDDDENDDDLLPLGSLQDTLQTAQVHQHLVEEQASLALSDISIYLSDNKNKSEVLLAKINTNLSQLVKSSEDMVKSLQHALTVLNHQDKVRRVQLEHEREKCRVLQDALHVLAEEHHSLEQSLGVQSLQTLNMVDSGDEDEFHDCIDARENGTAMEMSKDLISPGRRLIQPEMNAGSGRTTTPRGSTTSSDSFQSIASDDGDKHLMKCEKHGSEEDHEMDGVCNGGYRSKGQGDGSYRCQLPAPMFSRSDFSVWSILKQCIGRELSKITMPVIFNEPLSFLQRIVEYMEYSDLLKKASEADDPVKRLEYVTAFAVSATASNWERLGKPFNPLLGETYELDREDLGFKIVCEQVSHHPPISAFHTTSSEYTLHGAIHPKLKFWGKSIEITPKGIVTLVLHRHSEVYSWQNVNCCVHNIIVGKIWIEHYGSMEISCLTTGLKSVLHFKPSGWFSKELHKVEGFVIDNNKRKLKAFYGKWIEALYSHDIEVWEQHCKGGMKEDMAGHAMPEDNSDSPPPVTVKTSSVDLQLPGQEELWQATPKPPNSSKYYSFTLFAMMLNEITDAQNSVLPPTDCRRRPDIRKMEEGDLDGASAEKNRLEEKQRAARKERKKKKEEWTPRWFTYDVNPHTKKEDWLFNGDYWDRDWSKCPDIF